jgi:hypothetical protein
MDDKGGGDYPTPYSPAIATLADEPYSSFTPAHREVSIAMVKPKGEHVPMHRDVTLVAAKLVKQSDDRTRPIPLPPELATAISKKLRSAFSTISAQSAAGGYLCLGASRNGGSTFIETDKAASDAVSPLKQWILQQPQLIRFFWSSMQLSCNTVKDWHLHHSSVGSALAIGLGDFKDNSAESPTDSNRDVHDLRNRCLLIDSQELHRLHPLVAIRGSHYYSIICFVHSAIDQLDDADLEELRKLPMRWPSQPPKHSLPDFDEALADRLAAAKSILWRGKGELPQRHWPQERRGLWLIIDLWSGIASLCVALAALNVRAIVLRTESDPVANECGRVGFPNAVCLWKTEQIHAHLFLKVFKRRSFEGILVGSSSSFKHRDQGSTDIRCNQTAEIQRIADAMKVFGVPVVKWLECAASAPAVVVAQHSEIMMSEPLYTSAAQTGYVRRNRHVWAHGPSSDILSTNIKLPTGWTILRSTGKQQTQLVYRGDKPIPPSVRFDQGYQLRFDPANVVERSGDGAIFPFSQPYYHKNTTLTEVDAATTARFLHDNRRYPVKAYEDNSVLWRGEESRPPNSTERARIYEIPPDLLATAGKAQGAEKSEAVRCSLISHVSHMPTLFVALYMMLQLAPALSLSLPQTSIPRILAS